ncbi:hypothetical protein RJT34_24721 [Clitoria ternatea]|uniref:Uncharacterized protein n=1 Tax=Clitoria ternatea TaxID=43366 RepID=A0AAN9FNR7_CLITE
MVRALSCRVLEATSVGILVSDFIGPSLFPPSWFCAQLISTASALQLQSSASPLSSCLYLTLMPRTARKLSQTQSYWFWYVDGEGAADKHVRCSTLSRRHVNIVERERAINVVTTY